MLNKIGLKYGLIGLGIYTLYLIIGWQINLKLLINPILGLLIPILIYVIGILSQLAARKANGGFLDFTYTLQVYMVTILIVLLGYGIVAFLIFNVFDPAANKEVTRLAIEQSMEMMGKIFSMAGQENVIEEAGTEAIMEAATENGSTYSAFNLILSVVISIFMYTVGGLISAAIIRKDEPMTFQ